MLNFVQSTAQLPPNPTPNFELKEVVTPSSLTNGSSAAQFQFSLDDGGAGPDDDFNDLVVDIKTVADPSAQPDYILGTPQVDATAGLLDLTKIGQGGLELELDFDSYAALTNTLSFVKVAQDALTGQLTVGGVAAGAAGFLDKVRDNLIDFSVALGGEGNSGSANVTVKEAGFYAPVLTTGNGDVLTFGASGGSDGLAHLKVLGQNTFSFEDLLQSQNSDFDYNDFILKVQVGAV